MIDRWVKPSQCGVTLEWFVLVLLVAVLEVTLVLVSSAAVVYLSVSVVLLVSSWSSWLLRQMVAMMCPVATVVVVHC